MSTTSKLTSLTATPSTPGSYHTADDLTSQPDNGTVTETSSPVTHCTNRQLYRDARQLLRELRAHTAIYLEEQLYQSALHNLNILVTAGGSPLLGHTLKPALVPTPPQIALLGTLIIHPSFTTRATAGAGAADASQAKVAAQAYQLLRSILVSVGPVNARISEAFEFRANERVANRVRRRGARGEGSGSGDEYGGESGQVSVDDGDDEDEEHLKGRMSNEASVWVRGADFWVVVGWAFNCAKLHPTRWRFWRVWLELMLDVLEQDWIEREQLDLQGPVQNGQAERQMDWPYLRESLLMAYIKGRRDGRTGLRNILRAIFANGSAADSSLYLEIFERETVVPSGNKRKREQAVDLENDKFGDYLDEDELLASEGEPNGEYHRSAASGNPRSRRKGSQHAMPEKVAQDGSEQSVPLRVRLLSLLSRASYRLSDAFIPVDDLYEQYCDWVRNQPIQLFARFVACQDQLLEEQYAYFLRTILDKMLPTNSPDPEDIDKETEDQNGISAALLEHCFLPFAANNNSLDSNAKLSLVLEQMLRLVWKRDGNHVGLVHSDGLRDALLKGLDAREAKTRRKKMAKSATNGEETAARDALEDSARGLSIMIDILEAEAR